MNLATNQYSEQIAQAAVAKRRAENVKVLEAKQQQLELESFRRSEAIEAGRREQLRKQRQNERLLQEAAAAAEREEQDRIKTEKEERERKRLQELEDQRKRIEQAKLDEKERLAVREKQLREQREAAAAVKAEEERRRLKLLEETAGVRMKKSYDRLLEKLDATIGSDRQMMEDDTASRRRERQLASDAATALNRVKAIEGNLLRHREIGRIKLHEKTERTETGDLLEKFHVSICGTNEASHYHPEETAREMSPEKLRKVLLAGGGSGGTASYVLNLQRQQTLLLQQQHDEQQQLQVGEGDDDDNVRNQKGTATTQPEQLMTSSISNSNDTTNFLGTSVTSPDHYGTTAKKKRELRPLDYATWQKQREAESELVGLALEYQMRNL